MKPLAWSVGLQSRGAITLGKNPKMEEVAAIAARCKIKDVIIFGKDHTGFCFHPTQYGIMHPNLKINLTKGMTDALHRRKIRAIAYVNFGMDGEAGRRNAEWLQQTEPGKPTLLTPDHYADCCIYSGYLEEYLLPMSKEMILTCGVDGIFFDTMDAFKFCRCPKCQAAFLKDTGKKIPADDTQDDPAWRIYSPWQFERMRRVMNEVREALFKVKNDLEIIFNHIGGPSYPYALPGVEQGVVSCDPPAFFPWISLFASYQSALPHTGDIFIERFARGWGDRCANEIATMRYKSAAIFAHRQRFCIGDRMHQDWKLAPGTKNALKIIYGVWNEFKCALPDNLKSAPDFILLYPESYCSGFAHKSFIGDPERKTANRLLALGAFRIMLDCGRSFQLTPEMTLANHLHSGRTLILPGVEYLSPASEETIRKFVASGGKVLITERLPRLDDGTIPEWCGISNEKSDSDILRFGAVYLPDLGSCRRKKDEERPLVRSNMAELELAGAEVVLQAYNQEYGEFLHKTPYASFYMSSTEEPMKTPLLCRNRYGRGNVWFLNCGLLYDYADSALPLHKRWMENLLRKIHPHAHQELISPDGEVEIVTYRNGEESLHVLLNHGGRRTSLKYLFTSEQMGATQPHYPLELKIRTRFDIEVAVDGKSVPCYRKGGFVHIPIVMDTQWKFVRIKDIGTHRKE